MRYSIIFASVALLGTSAAAGAACNPVFRSGDESVTITGVEIEPDGNASDQFQVRVGNDGSPGGGPCNATIRVSRIGGVPDPNLPPYTLRAPGNSNIEVLPNPSQGGTANSDVRIANAPSGAEGRAVPFHVDFVTEWGLRAGQFTDQLQLSLYDEQGNLKDTVNLTLRITVPPVVSLRLVGALGGLSGGPVRIDLGNLSPTSETRSDPFGALILSTAPYNVSFSSANRGRLRHALGEAEVPYSLYFDSQLVELSGENRFDYARHTPSNGDFRSLLIVVPPVTAAAGSYSDRVTVTVTAM